MANVASAEKRNRQRIKRRARNQYHLTTMRTYVKRVRAAIEERIARGVGRLALPVTAFLPDLETALGRFGEEIIKPYANA